MVWFYLKTFSRRVISNAYSLVCTIMVSIMPFTPARPYVKDCGVLTLARCQMPTKTTLSVPLLSWTEERRYSERLMG